MSDTTYVTKNVIHMLQPHTETTTVNITTMTAESKAVDTDLVYGLEVRAYNGKEYYPLPPSYSHDKLPIHRDHIPTSTTLRQWPHLVQVANELPSDHEQDIPVGLLIGNTVMNAYRPQQLINSNNDNEPFAIKTALGWKVMGNCNSHTTLATLIYQPVNREVITFKCTTRNDKDLARLINVYNTNFHDAHDNTPCTSIEDKQFLDIMREQTTTINGRVTMPLPFKAKPPTLDTKTCALHRFTLLERKFKQNPDYKKQYHAFMNDIITKGEAVPAITETNNCWYIPHFGVYHPRKPDRLRVVFDCAAKVGGVSLNDFLLQGPEHMNDLQGILLRFRKEQVALMGDIERMFHQFKVESTHQDYLRFIWYDAEGQLTTYKMTVHLFGARSSPACATYGLRYLADRFKEASEHHQPSHHFIHRNFYVDDGLTSVSSETEAVNLITQSRALCATGQLRLHKIVSNSRRVMAQLPRSECASALANLELSSDPLPQERSLGVLWHTDQDLLTFHYESPTTPDTRRGILSAVASVFDPLGLVAPFTLKGRTILQETCKRKADWDSPLDSALTSRWDEWKEDLTNISHIQIPRCLKPKSFEAVKFAQLHTFSDASTTGYGHCTYLRLVDTSNTVHVSLLASKAKVAPIKQVTVPRLELQAACDAARAVKKYHSELDMPNLSSYFYSDSTAVLGYINNTSERFHTFVANRVETIRDVSEPTTWSYVPTSNNPADMASRGASTSEIRHSSWFSGPEFLWTEPITIVPQPQLCVSPLDAEVKTTSTTFKTTLHPLFTIETRLKRFSEWKRAVRAVAVIQRAANKNHVLDLTKAELTIIKLAQGEHFAEDISAIQANKPVSRDSSLLRLNPFLDTDGVLRVGGRLQESSVLSFHEKHPIIIPKSSHIALLLVRHHHRLAAHQGREATLTQIRSHGFWIINVRSHIYKCLNNCVTCKKIRGKPQIPQMATLPAERVAEVAPFTHCGIDCFGPFFAKQGRKELKTYGLIITCLASRAVHLELLEDMSSDSFIGALRNVIAMRGTISTIRCDQGTNFVGAFNDLAKNMEGSALDELTTKFIFNPPHSSNMGGVWERLIRSARNIMKGMAERHGGRLTIAQLRTLLYEIMAVMNSRPLGPVTDDNVPLTPNMLLTMKSQVTLPPPGSFEQSDVYSKRRWRAVQQLANEFWRRWRNEYLQSLQTRQKWTKNSAKLTSVGDIVHVIGEGSLRNDWLLGRVVELNTSHDGEVRSVKLQIATKSPSANGLKFLTRPVSKVVTLVKA